MLSLLRRLFPAAVADAIAGDLEEERRRRSAASAWRARFWYWRTALAIAVFAATRLAADVVRRIVMSRFGFRHSHGDFLHAARALRRAPWYSATVVGVISVGMALATATFAIVDGVLFRPLPYRDAGELFSGGGGYSKVPGQHEALSEPDIAAWTAAVPEAAIASFGLDMIFGKVGELDSRGVRGIGISPTLLSVLGVAPLIGGFTSDNFDAPATVRPALISYGVWQRVFGGNIDVLGARLDFAGNAGSVQVAGVLPPGFLFPSTGQQPDILVPLQLPPPRPGGRAPAIVQAIVRLPQGVSLPSVQSRLDAAMANIAPPASPTSPYGSKDRASLHRLSADLTESSRPTLATVAAASGLLLLLGCLSLAGLGVARAEDGSRQIALRRALGAGSWAIARLQLAEVTILSVAGSAFGLTLAPAVLTATVRLLPDRLSLLKTPAIDTRVLAFAALATTLTSMLTAIWPAMTAARTGLSSVSFHHGTATRPVQHWGQRLLVSSQVALALVLAVGGTLVVSSLVLLWREDPGYAVSDAVVVEFTVPSRDVGSIRAQAAAVQEVVAGTSGVRATTTFDGPLLNQTQRADISWRFPAGASRTCLFGSKIGVSAGFFDVTGLLPTAGRALSAAEMADGQPVAVVSTTMARLCWPGNEPLGQALTMNDEMFTVVGVVPDARMQSLDERARGQIYVSDLRLPPRASKVVFARTSQTTGASLTGIVEALRGAGMMPRVSRVVTMRDALADSIRPRRLNAWLFGVFGGTALAVVAIGILGLIAMVTARRTREIGIRYALGGTRTSVIGLMLREQSVAVGLGLAAGAVASTWSTQLLSAYLYRFTPTDPRLWMIAIATVALTTLLGVLIPAWWASRVDPVHALRVE